MISSDTQMQTAIYHIFQGTKVNLSKMDLSWARKNLMFERTSVLSYHLNHDAKIWITSSILI